MPDNPPAKRATVQKLADKRKVIALAATYVGVFVALAGCLANAEIVTILGLLVFAVAMSQA